MKGTQAFLAGLVALLLAGVAGNPANALQVAPEGLSGPGRPSEDVLRAFVPVEFGNLKTNPTRFCELAARQDFLAQGETAQSCLRSHWHGQFPYMGWDEYAEFSRVGYKANEVYLFPLDRGKFQDFVVASNGGVNLDVASGNNSALVVENSMLKQRLDAARAEITDLKEQLASTPARVSASASSNLGREAGLEIQILNKDVQIGELERQVRDLNARLVDPQAAIDAAVQVALAKRAEVSRLEVARVQENATATITATRNQAQADIDAAQVRFAEAERNFNAAMKQASLDLAAAKAVTAERDGTISSLNHMLGTQEATINSLNTTVASLDNWGAYTAIKLNNWMASAIDFANAHPGGIVLFLVALLVGMLAYRSTDAMIAGFRRFRPSAANATS